MKMGPMGCPETSVRQYHYTPRIIPQERRSLLHRGGSLNSRDVKFTFTKKYEESKLCKHWLTSKTEHLVSPHAI